MFLIIGHRTVAFWLATLFLTCDRCHHTGPHVLQREATKLTLFFIPLIPVGSAHILGCTVCGKRRTVKKDAAADIVEQARRSPAGRAA